MFRRLVFRGFRKIAQTLEGTGIGLLPFADVMYNFVYRCFVPNEGEILIDVQGNKMYVNTQDTFISKSLIVQGHWEKYQSELFKKEILPGMRVIDIGAHIGYFSLIAAKLVGHAGMVFSFEPSEYNFKLLKKNVNVNEYTNILPINKAVCDFVGESDFYEYTPVPSSGWHGLSRPVDEATSKLTKVDTTTLDSCFGDTHVDVIKIDAEGAEVSILRGAKRLLSANESTTIFTEFNPKRIRATGDDPAELIDLLCDFGFAIRVIEHNKVIDNDLDRSYPDSLFADLLCTKRPSTR
jgi:FkbM family methyltransferase